ncbi:hypothetical protein SAMN05216262_11150 [Colwellia chukchiensis]|uniref:Phosphate-selective porin O and P n=1 Tax=Colwellia chukchiensis TaxID=641665 RepID=A0A1H7QDM9_9GAMM|nr:hypothetical protein [Colwellia chukchiensis]SEL45407.1 hypothetical protein SAMN05216262_11150 [Colwellia chukchiensis]
MKQFVLMPLLLLSSAVLAEQAASTTLTAADHIAQQQKIAEIERQLQVLKAQSQAMLTSQKAPAATTTSPLLAGQKNWQIKSYGSARYKSEQVFRNTQDLEPNRRASTDLERVVLEIAYDFTPKWQLEFELEYEHGGTGVTLEYDGFEEFGEFESEIEAGGEVVVEKLQLRYQANPYLAVKMGRIFIPVGIGTELHKPAQYMTAERHWSEATMIPQTWNETGFNIMANWQNFNAQILLTTGLNSEYFRTYQWAATGHQKRFEQTNADDLALTFRLDYGDIKKDKGIGFSYYTSDTTGNRNNQNNLAGDGNIEIIGLHGAWTIGNWIARGQYLYGQLDDSAAITLANKTTAGLKPGNFSQLGSEAESAFVELGYNAQGLLGLSSQLRIFAAYDYANPIKKVADGIATSRFDKQELSFGVNYFPIPELVFKMQVAEQHYAQENLDNTRSVALSLGYFFTI